MSLESDLKCLRDAKYDYHLRSNKDNKELLAKCGLLKLHECLQQEKFSESDSDSQQRSKLRKCNSDSYSSGSWNISQKTIIIIIIVLAALAYMYYRK